MPNRIKHDPSIQICPDYSGEEFTVIHATAASHRGVSDQSIAEELSCAWSVRNDAAKAAWAAQQAEDRAQQGNNDGTAIPDTTNTTVDRKKATLAPFDPSHAAPDFLCPALRLLQLTNSRLSNTSSSEDVLVLRPITAHKLSKAAIANDKLSWQQMEMGFTGMLAEMESVGWDTQHHGVLTNLFWNLTNHEYCSRPHSETVLITYQAQIRRHWHDTLKHSEGYNITTINDRLLVAIMEEYLTKLSSPTSAPYQFHHSGAPAPAPAPSPTALAPALHPRWACAAPPSLPASHLHPHPRLTTPSFNRTIPTSSEGHDSRRGSHRYSQQAPPHACNRSASPSPTSHLRGREHIFNRAQPPATCQSAPSASAGNLTMFTTARQ
ncbi:hypothetical protein NEOLEDRAFT_1178865 [Neolentinus lepideus HHB14362 ss-1]|uniref:Uncharacterized protein n=1 Tax=Neolentinus lepideus HHB14362 ss-1 TaxID=1314782 RepID=A0A165S7Q7_9AGAM|nr:hypothetical protein NEOLEDRAFT_1178865 [Neolentinus lepideus HHB14362 ss-1]